jgi:hypothetical protein
MSFCLESPLTYFKSNHFLMELMNFWLPQFDIFRGIPRKFPDINLIYPGSDELRNWKFKNWKIVSRKIEYFSAVENLKFETWNSEYQSKWRNSLKFFFWKFFLDLKTIETLFILFFIPRFTVESLWLWYPSVSECNWFFWNQYYIILFSINLIL